MNNNELSPCQNAGNIDQPQSLIKLPIIFALIMLGCSLLSFIINNYIINPIDRSSATLSFNEDIFISIVIQSKYLLLHFCIAFVFCIVQKMHQVTAKNILVMFIIGVIYAVVQKIFLLGYGQLYSLSREAPYFTPDNLELLLTTLGFISFMLRLLILAGIFQFVGSINRHQSVSYVISPANFPTLFALLFTVIFVFPTMLFSVWGLSDKLMSFMYSIMYLFIFYIDDDYIIWFLFIMTASAFLTFLATLINFLIIYFIVRGCFVRQFSTIPFKLLFKSVGWAYLYLIGFNIVIGIIYFLLVLGISSSMDTYSLRNSAMGLIMFCTVIFLVISIVGNIKLIRKAVRNYFA